MVLHHGVNNTLLSGCSLESVIRRLKVRGNVTTVKNVNVKLKNLLKLSQIVHVLIMRKWLKTEHVVTSKKIHYENVSYQSHYNASSCLCVN